MDRGAGGGAPGTILCAVSVVISDDAFCVIIKLKNDELDGEWDALTTTDDDGRVERARTFFWRELGEGRLWPLFGKFREIDALSAYFGLQRSPFNAPQLACAASTMSSSGLAQSSSLDLVTEATIINVDDKKPHDDWQALTVQVSVHDRAEPNTRTPSLVSHGANAAEEAREEGHDVGGDRETLQDVNVVNRLPSSSSTISQQEMFQTEDDDIPVIVDVPDQLPPLLQELNPDGRGRENGGRGRRGIRGVALRLLAFLGRHDQGRRALLWLIWTEFFNFAQVSQAVLAFYFALSSFFYPASACCVERSSCTHSTSLFFRSWSQQPCSLIHTATQVQPCLVSLNGGHAISL